MVTKMLNKKLKKVEIKLRSPIKRLFTSTIMPLLRDEKAFRLMMGSAPRGALERGIQEFIDSNKQEEDS